MKFYSIEILAIVLAMVAISIFVVVWIRKQDHLEREAEKLMPPRGQTPTEEDVVRLVRAGHKIAAIKLHREIHGTGLAESKKAVEALASGAPSNPTAPEHSPTLETESVDEEVLRLVRAGQKIEAIKLYREAHGVGLAEAKAAVEDWKARSDRD